MDETIKWLVEKRDAGVKQVRVTSVIERVQALVDRVEAAENLELVGTKEAAEVLNVERARIGKWRAVGKMPEPIADLGAGPVWHRHQIVAMLSDTNARRRQRVGRVVEVELSEAAE